MINPSFDDIRTKICEPINALMSNIPAKDVLNGLTFDEMTKLWQDEEKRIMQLICVLEQFLATVEAHVQVMIDKQVFLDFRKKPAGTFGLYTQCAPDAPADPNAVVDVPDTNPTPNGQKTCPSGSAS